MKSFFYVRKYALYCIVLLCVLFIGFYGEKHYAREDFTYAIASTPQDAFYFVDQKNQNTLLIDPAKQTQFEKQYLTHYFMPWKLSKYYPFFYIKKAVIDNYHYYFFHPGFGINHLQNSDAWLKKIYSNTDIKHFPNTFVHAITVQNTDIRVLPTNQPIFDSFEKAGQGYPFDDLETTSLVANTPVLILQTTKDKAWFYIVTNNSDGWVPSPAVAVVDDNFMKHFKTNHFVVLTQNHVAIIDEHHVMQFTAGIGKILPELINKHPVNKNHVEVLIAVSDSEHHAVLKKAWISSDKMKPWPIAMTQFNVASMMNAMLGTKYTWGGMNGGSDCSLTTMNLFASFGVWLPRHSSLQADTGKQINLSQLSDFDKKKIIVQEGVPFATVLYMPGHIQTYLGEKNGAIYVFQTVWGVHSENVLLEPARAKIGKTIISRLDLGAGDINVRKTWLDRITKMTKLIN